MLRLPIYECHSKLSRAHTIRRGAVSSAKHANWKRMRSNRQITLEGPNHAGQGLPRPPGPPAARPPLPGPPRGPPMRPADVEAAEQRAFEVVLREQDDSMRATLHHRCSGVSKQGIPGPLQSLCIVYLAKREMPGVCLENACGIVTKA